MIKELTDIKGIGKKRAESFARLGINTVDDLLHYVPRRYIDFTQITKLGDVPAGETCACCGEIVQGPSMFRAKGYMITNCTVEDSSGKARITWFNQPYITSLFRNGDIIYFYGTAEMKGRTPQFNSPKSFKQNPVIIPVYPSKAGIKQSMIVSAVRAALEGNTARETLPAYLLDKYNLMPLHDALCAIHFPHSREELAQAKRRLAFEDMLLFRIALNIMRLRKKKKAGIEYDTQGVLDEYKKKLPFELTEGQESVIADIESDMASPHPMNRLVQGDVGSGKTAVAVYAMEVACKNGYQSVLLAPTEILAVQHYNSICTLTDADKVVLLTGSMTQKQKKEAYGGIAEGRYMYIVGTHALLQSKLDFYRPGLIICDEQHKFGVEQRSVLQKKAGNADVMLMSATPIPRTLALALYGDMDVSQIHGMPRGRQKVRTRLVPQEKRRDMYAYLRDEAKAGRQAYVVCPQIENDEGEETSDNVKSVYDELRAMLDIPIGILHGKMRAAEKNAAIEGFRSGSIKILVSTTVIEVGVDVPSAVNMAIENADKFGLSQLHQLRGRIGRGAQAGYCFLVSDTDNQRLSALCATSDGFEIAEKDLALRGPGQFLGTAQHGESEIALLALASDMETLESARQAADEMFVDADAADSEIIKRALRDFDTE